MSEKTDTKKQLIIDKATEVFANKGFREVTMSDIVDACEISRGSLYNYYESKEKLFMDVMKTQDEEEDARSNTLVERLRVASSSELLLWFLKEQKKEILKRKNSLAVAAYEYAFYCRQNLSQSNAKDRFDTATLVLEKILTRGVETGEFDCEEPGALARNMMYTFEGMKVCARTMGLSEKKVDKELVYMMRQFMEVED